MCLPDEAAAFSLKGIPISLITEAGRQTILFHRRRGERRVRVFPFAKGYFVSFLLKRLMRRLRSLSDSKLHKATSYTMWQANIAGGKVNDA